MGGTSYLRLLRIPYEVNPLAPELTVDTQGSDRFPNKTTVLDIGHRFILNVISLAVNWSGGQIARILFPLRPNFSPRQFAAQVTPTGVLANAGRGMQSTDTGTYVLE